ncbi:rod shape-determining protein MreD [Thermosyntropha sp.]|uniref:rod shape-determining protein MreD n=1 Tax=Thermosyntropha sp. TaxID=2740820 RepID=UPI0025EC4EAB|nr:rod shape-determining protein MreD [Thermosyntropha sp.]MBO8158786.1 rod shape-determining protein MreD [Thermosyntropha sp.]
MRYFVLFVLPVMAIFLQSTLFGFYNINGVVPDLVLIFVIFFALFNGAEKGAVYGYLCGLLEDLFLGRFVGFNALSKALTAYIAGRLQGNVFKENIMVGALGVFLATILNGLFLFLLSFIGPIFLNIDFNMLKMLLLQSLYNLFLAVPVYIWYYNASNSGVLRHGGER